MKIILLINLDTFTESHNDFIVIIKEQKKMLR